MAFFFYFLENKKLCHVKLDEENFNDRRQLVDKKEKKKNKLNG